MAINNCGDPSNYECGDSVNCKTGESVNTNLVQNLDCKKAFQVGEAEVISVSRKRTFTLSTSHSSNMVGPKFVMHNQDDAIFICNSGTTETNNNQVAESYEYTVTKLCYLDLRYNNAAGTEITEKLTFSNTNAERAGFKEVWGVQYYAKFHIVNANITKTTKYFIIINGVKTVLDTITEVIKVYKPGSPLILVYPNPPSMAIPWVNCEDIKTYGFYDYHGVDGSAKIQKDGGDDFYFTDWMRMCGGDNRVEDQAKADERYFAYYLQDGGPGTVALSTPGILYDQVPRGSMAVDRNGNVFYSFKFGSKYFNGIQKGNLEKVLESKLIPTGNNIRFYPIGVV